MTTLELRSAPPARTSATPRAKHHSKGRILAIEPDRDRAATLGHLLPAYVGDDFAIVKTAAEAIRSITERVPDLVLTSTFLPPPEEAALTARLNASPAAAHLQVITVPHFIDSEDTARRERPKVLNFLKRRSALSRLACNSDTVGEQIKAYLEQAHVMRLALANRALCNAAGAPAVVAPRAKPEMSVVRPMATGVNTLAHAAGAYRLGRAHAQDRRRASRRLSGDLPSLWTVRLPWGADVKVVDISSQGVLLETTSKITPGRTVDLQLLGQDLDLRVAARTIRSEVAAVDTMGVRYRVAAAFARDLDILKPAPEAAGPSVMPTALADLLTQVLTGAGHDVTSAAARARFEQGLRRLLPVRDIQIRPAPVMPSGGSESIYFTVPRSSGRRAVLQAIFEPDYQPSAAEFKLLKAAASLAAVVLEFAPRGLSEA
jgi:CheY-like chemotaxis protein